MRFLIPWLLLISTAAWSANTTSRLLVVGDSLSAAYGLDESEGWVALLRNKLTTQCPGWEVINASISGDTTAGGRDRLPALLAEHAADAVVIELGGNDGLRGLSPQAMEANLRAMTKAAQEAGAQVSLLGVRLPPNYGERFNRMFAERYEAVARELGIPLVAEFLQGIDDRPELMQADGIHPTAAAQPKMVENAWPAIRQALDRAPAGCSHIPAR